jgi:8-oxo-dGTP pyrophosphatase MutT (NUDIX family)
LNNDIRAFHLPPVPTARLLELLRSYVPVDADDGAVRSRFIAFVAAQRRCLDRALEIGHVTGSAWIVDAAGDRVLLTHHRKLGIWVQPGGHADGDPDLAAVAMREAEEETGLAGLRLWREGIFDLDIHPIPGRDGIPRHEHFDVRFALRTTGSEAFVVSDESHALAWVQLDELERISTEPSLLRMRAKWRAWAAPESPPPLRGSRGATVGVAAGLKTHLHPPIMT